MINGFAKGAGMIAPDLATMLAYIFTDAAVDQAALQAMLAAGADKTFNCITIDSDTSTSDTVLLFATGAAAARGAPAIKDASSADGRKFAAALHDLMHELALWVVKDGEGLTKLIQIDVTGAESDAAARRIGFSIANSPLVKTAMAGGDPNWGRVVMAVGKAGEAADRDRLSITYGRPGGGQGRRAGADLRREDGCRLHGRAARSRSASTSASAPARPRCGPAI